MRFMKPSSLKLFALAIALPAACSSEPLDGEDIVDPPAAEAVLGGTPFLGFSTWSVESSTHRDYGTKWLTESHVKNASDAMAAKLQAAGYSYINIDAGWNANLGWNDWHFDGNGIPSPDHERFPSGIAGVASYVHAKGQKLGLYFTVGLEKKVYDGNHVIAGTSCRTRDIAKQPLSDVPNGWSAQYEIDWSNPCAQAYYDSIADRFASWGIDLLKIDGTTARNAPDIKAWQKALAQTGRPIWLTVSAWPVPLSIGDDLRQTGNSIRVDTDVECYCGTVANWGHSVVKRWNDLPSWLPHVGPGHFPDLDSLPINNNTGSGIQDGLNDVERQSAMTFWSMASAPLYVGGDLYFLDAGAQAILTNPEVIAVDQAALMPARLAGGEQQKWKKPLPDGSTAVAVYNLGSSPASITVSWSEVGLAGEVRVRDLVERRDLGSFRASWTASNVPAHGSRLIKLSGASGAAGPDGYSFCASENQTCSFSGTRDVAYGANGTFVYRTGVGASIGCSNAVFGDPLPGTAKACYTRASAAPSAYEAEAGTPAGAARRAGCSTCSGGSKVGYLGNGAANRLTLEHVIATNAGSHRVTLVGTVGGTRSFFVSVNGGAGVEVPMSGSSWASPVSVTVDLTLAVGENRLSFYNDDAYAPDLDRIVVE
jgi:Alpha galactosidase A/Alpha galactosidase C-terminal beta sandwich domain